MRLAIASWSSRRVGGVEDYIAALLPALSERGIELAFWHESDGPADRAAIPIPPGVPAISVQDAGIGTAFDQLRAWRPDLIYSQGIHDPAIEARLLDIAPAMLFLHTYTGTCISGTKMFAFPEPTPCERTFGVMCLANYFPRRCGGSNPATMVNLFRSQSKHLAMLHRYRAILTHTEHMRDEMKRHGVRATLVPFGVGAASSARPVSRNADAWTLLFAARMERLKGGDYLLHALPDVARAAGRPVHAIFAGDGTERVRWERTAREIEAATANLRIEFTGWIAQDAVDERLAQVDLLVVPSIWPEPFGMVGVGAAAHGVPAAAFAVGGIGQWLEDGVTGHLAPANPPTAAGLGRAILRCLADADHLALLGKGARHMAARFTMERHVAALMTELKLL
jgi:glycosyltransferase involved in cell wall biosynthesis